MKKLLLLLTFMLTIATMTAQTFNYQAAARDFAGELITNSNLGVEVKVRAGSVGGAVVFNETFTSMTNSSGVFNLAIGDGALVSGDLTMLDWGNVDYFLEIGVDPSGGAAYAVVGASQLRVVPVAMTSLQFEQQVGNTDVVALAVTVINNTGNLSSLSLSDANQESRIMALEGTNTDVTIGNVALDARIVALDARVVTLEGVSLDGTIGNVALGARVLDLENGIGIIETDPLFSASPANNIVSSGSLNVITGLERTAIGNNTNGITTNGTAIASNNTAIAANTGGLATNGNAIAANGAAIASNNTAIVANNTAIVSNNTAIVANDTDIASNNTAIVANDT
ncbi:MAG: hypothetical protein ACI840_002349, partial [Ulvibacter sp.]